MRCRVATVKGGQERCRVTTVKGGQKRCRNPNEKIP